MPDTKFKFQLFTSSNPDAQYSALTTKDAKTFYLLSNGKGYLGTQKLFDATETISPITDINAEGYTPSDTDLASTKAIVDYISSQINNLNVLSSNFMNNVTSYTLTDTDISDTEHWSIPDGTESGAIGLKFTLDDQNETTDAMYIFIPLTDYINSVYTFANTNHSVLLNTDDNNNVSAELNVDSNESSIKIDETTKQVSLAKTSSAESIDLTSPSNDNLITESVMVNFISQYLDSIGVVTYTEDDGTNN